MEDIDGAVGIRATIDANDIQKSANDFIQALMNMQTQANNAAKNISSDVSLIMSNFAKSDEGMSKQATNAAKTSTEIKNLGNSYAKASSDGGNFVNTLHKMQDAGASADAMFASLAKSAASFGIAFSAQEFASNVTNIRGQFQQIEMAFNTMLGSEQKATALMQQMVTTAASTPFDLQGVANGAKQLLAYGLEANQVNDTLVRLGDIAAGLSIPLNDIIYLYGTTMSQGRLYAQDLMQFTGRGIPMIAELAKQFGVSESKVKDLVSEGKVGFPEVQKAIEDLTNEGGKFGGLMDAQSKTLTGQLANLEDNIDMMFNEIGEKSEGAIGGAIELAADMVDHYKEIGSIIISIAAAWGMNKAATAAVAAVNNAAASQEIANLEQQIALIQQKNGISALDDDLGQQVKGGSIDLDKANQIQELRNQLKALHEEEIQAAQDAFDSANKAWEEAQMSFNSASTGVEDAKNVVDATNEQIDAIKEKIAVAFNEGDAEAFAAGEAELAAAIKQKETAAENLSTASKTKETAATNVQAAAIAKNTAATNLSSTSKKAQIVQQNIDTASKSANSLATKALTWATGQLTTAFNGLKAAFASNPIGMAITAISIGIGIFSAFSDSTEEATEEVKKFGEEAVKTQANANTLLAVVNSVDKNSKVYKDSIEELCGIYNEYGIQIDEEKDKLFQVNRLRNELINLIQQEGQARINANALESYNKSIEKEADDLKKELQKSFSSSYDAIDEDALHAKFSAGTEMKEALIEAGEQWQKFSNMSEQASVVASSIITSYASKWKEANGNVNEQNQLLSQMYSSFKGQMSNMGVDITYLKTGFADYAKSGLNNIAVLMAAQAQYAKKVQEDSDRTAARQEANNDITKMSVEDLIKSYNEASSSVSELGEKEAKPKVDSSDAEKATEEHDKASNASDNLDKKKAKPKVDSSEADIARNKVSTLSNLLAKLSGTQWYVRIKSIFDRNTPPKGNGTNTNGGFGRFPFNNNLPWSKPQPQYNGPFITPVPTKKSTQPKKQAKKKQTIKTNKHSQKDYLNQIEEKYTDQINNAHSNDAIDNIVKDLKAKVNSADDRTELRKMLVRIKAKAIKKQKKLNKSAGNETGGGKKSGKKGTTRTKSAAEINSDRISIQKDAKEKEANEIAKMQQEFTDDSIKYMDESLKKEIKEIDNNKTKEEKALEDWLNAIIKSRKSVSEKLWKAGNHKKGETWLNTKDGKKTDAQWREDVLSDSKISAVYNKRNKQIVDNSSKDKATAIKEHFAEYDNLSDKEKQIKKLRSDIQFLEQELQKTTNETSKNEIDKLRQNAQAQLDWVSQSKDAWNEYYQKYGTFLEKRAALEEKFLHDTQGLDKNSPEYKAKYEEYKQNKSSLSTSELKSNIDWSSVFSDIGMMSSKMAKVQLANLQAYTQTDEYKGLEAKDKQAISEAIDKLEKEAGPQIIGSFKNFGKAVDAYRKQLVTLSVLQDNEIKAQNALIEAKNVEAQKTQELADAQEELKQATESGKDADIQAAQKNLEAAQKNLKSAQENYATAKKNADDSSNAVRTQTDITKQSRDDVKKHGKNLTSSFDTITSVFQNLKSGSLSGTFNSIVSLVDAFKHVKEASNKTAKQQEKDAKSNSESAKQTKDSQDDASKALNATSAALSAVPEQWSKIVSAALSVLDILGDDLEGGIGNLAGALLEKVGNIIETLLSQIGSGKFFADLGKGVWNLVSGIGRGFGDAFGMRDNWNSYRKASEQYEKLDKVWTSLISKKKEYLSLSYGDEAKKVGEEYIELAKTDLKATKLIAKQFLGAWKKGSHSAGYKFNEKMKGSVEGVTWSDVSRTVGTSITDVSQLADLSKQQLESLKENYTEWWVKLPGKYQEYLDSIIDKQDTLDDATQDVLEKLTGVKFDDMYSNFMSALTDMSKSADDWVSDFKDKIRSAIIENMMGEKVKSWMKDYTERYQAAMKAGNGTISEAQKQQFIDEAKEMSNQFYEERKQITENVGLGKSSTESSKSGGYATASEESIEELSGRALATNEALYSIRNQQLIDAATLVSINDGLQVIVTIENKRNAYYDESIEIQRTSVSHLAAIEKNTNELYTMNAKLTKIERNTRNM